MHAHRINSLFPAQFIENTTVAAFLPLDIKFRYAVAKPQHWHQCDRDQSIESAAKLLLAEVDPDRKEIPDDSACDHPD